jgi:hypothetical protein
MSGTRYRRSTEVLTRAFGDEMLVTAADDDEVVRLEGPGLAVWEVLEAPRSLPEMVSILADAYQTSPDMVTSGVTTLLAELQRRGLIERIASDDA